MAISHTLERFGKSSRARLKMAGYGHFLMASLLGAALCSCAAVKTTGTYSLSGSPVTYMSSGHGQPVVVFESGWGNGKEVWDQIVPAIERTHAIFAYDRPGYGGSAGVAGTRDPCTVATEEHNLLHSMGIAPPYILVGHSIGGLYQYVYTKLYPQDVAGVVLVDPTAPGHLGRLKREVPKLLALVSTVKLSFNDTVKHEFDDMDVCLDRIDTATPLSVPAHVLRRTRFDLIELGAFEQMEHRNTETWGRLAGRPADVIANSGHYIQKDRPQTVIDAIAAVSREISQRSKTE
jgi:pimeloyl-ACP methyl ester carboxylesterase